MFKYRVAILDAILNNSKCSTMPAGHHSDSDSTLLPLPKSSITWFGGIFARLPPLAAGLYLYHSKILFFKTDNIKSYIRLRSNMYMFITSVTELHITKYTYASLTEAQGHLKMHIM